MNQIIIRELNQIISSKLYINHLQGGTQALINIRHAL